MTHFMIIEQDGETARLECKTLEEAYRVRLSFVFSGKYSDIRIEVNND